MQLLQQFIAAILPLSQLTPPAWQGFCLTDCVSTGSCDTASRIFPLLPWLLIQALHAAASNLQLLRVMLLFRLPRLLLTCCEANCVCLREVLSAASSAAALGPQHRLSGCTRMWMMRTGACALRAQSVVAWAGEKSLMPVLLAKRS